MNIRPQLDFETTYASLPGHFYTKMLPEAFAKDPWLIHANPQAAELIGLDSAMLAPERMAAYFSGNELLPCATPLAMVYSGHQFGQWAGQLGDGRALLLGQVRNASGMLWDIQLKGSGKTPYSRFGDGRAVLRSSIREYLCSEAMHNLGIPTTRALCIVGTGEAVIRETMEPGAILTRLAQSHIRFGHFEHFYHRQQYDEVKLLADYVIDEYFSDIGHVPERYALWFSEVVKRTATLIARWQAVGFAHGVMNTDNMSILGLTLDYGPFGFMESFDPGFICNHSDTSGRYAYDQQPAIGLWNLQALAYCLQKLMPSETMIDILNGYIATYNDAYHRLMRDKLGLREIQENDDVLWHDLLALMEQQRADYTLTWRILAESFTAPQRWLDLFSEPTDARRWLEAYHARMRSENTSDAELERILQAANPAFVLRNWVAEKAIRAAEDEQDYTMLDKILSIMQNPFTENSAFSHFAAPAPVAYRDLCVSCSS